MKTYPVNRSGRGLRIGIARSRFSDGIGVCLQEACLSRLSELGVKNKHITLVTVPGALEIPLALQNLALHGSFDAMIALGVVIRGETYHFELVAEQSAAGIARVSLDFNIPIANAVLTTENEEQALARMRVKGREVAEAAVECARLLESLSESSPGKSR